MSTTRRRFLTLSAGAASGSCLAWSAAYEARAATDGAATIRCLDYGRSFIGHSGTENSVRFWIESRTTLIDPQTETSTDYYQCASCKSEDTFAERDLFLKDNYDFLPIIGGGQVLIFRRTMRLSPRYRDVRPQVDVWGQPEFHLRAAETVTVLDTWEQIHAATKAALPLVSQTEIASAKLGLRAVIECPVKTMNLSVPRKLYQVDTGPIAYPRLDQRYEPQIDCLQLAFVAFNAPHFADFIVEQPTPVVDGATELCQIYHYSCPFSLEAKNVLLALGSLPS